MGATPRRSPLARIGATSARHPFLFLGGWVLVLAVIFVTAILGLGGQSLFGRLSNGAPSVQEESYKGQQLLTTGTKSTTYTLLIHNVDLDSPALATLATDIGRNAASFPRTRYVDPLAVPLRADGSRQPALAPLFSTDGRGVLLSVSTLGVGDAAPTATAEKQVRTLLDSSATVARRDFPRATVSVGGGDLLLQSLLGQSSKDLERGETVALPIALVVMLVVFGGFIAAGLPLLGALASILGAFGALFATTFATDIDATVINVVTAVGLGLSIDYGLLLVSRFREEYRSRGGGSGLDAEGRRLVRVEAIGATTGSAGRTVAFSGTTFAIASLGLLVFEPAVVREIGIASVFVTVFAMLSGLTLMPALLSISGERLARPGVFTRIPGIRGFMGRFGDVAPDDGFFSRLTRRVQKHPALVTIACAVILLAIGSPLLSLQLANTSVDAIPRVSTQYTFTTTVVDDFPDAATPRIELVTRTKADAVAWATTVKTIAGVKSVGAPQHSGSAWGTLVRVSGSDGVTVVRSIRAAPPAFSHWVTGLDASTADLADSLVRGSPLALLIIVLGTVVLLFLMTGSLIVPLKALIASALSLGASMGVLVWGFQDGNFAHILNFDAAHVYGVDVIVLLLTIVFGFGLAMDYEMFLLSRIKERRDAGAAPREAIAIGLQRSGRIITSAALIIIVVFAGFAQGDLMIIKQLGIALAVAVLFDATLVRCLLVPAFMTWQQNIMWWAPRWAKRLHARIGLSD
ncbi:MAG TPA: MMPL family transporter [Galbitalea sp.]|jgi:RND superfamily putative drug exporter|nr:MMPL family transporter [Galbitalea sp.]